MGWSETNGMLVNGRYRISEQRDDRGFSWRLEWLETSGEGVGVRSLRCNSPSSARSIAAELDQRRARTLRATVHFAITIASLYWFVWLAAAELLTLNAYGVALLTLAIAVRSAGNAVGAKRLDLWGWQPDDASQATPSRFDLCCRWTVQRTSPSITTCGTGQSGNVRVLPPVG